jgi:hypothetical protein
MDLLDTKNITICKLVEDCTLDTIKTYAKAMRELFHQSCYSNNETIFVDHEDTTEEKESIKPVSYVDEEFEEFYEKCCILRILCSWDDVTLNEEDKEQYEFVKIIKKGPSSISLNDMLRAFELFPKVITYLVE